MIKIRITWPMLFFGLILLLIWLARDPDQSQPTPRRSPHRMRPRAGKAARGMIIDQNGDGGDDSTYDDETKRLDREAAEAGLRARRPRPTNPLRDKESYRDRAAATR